MFWEGLEDYDAEAGSSGLAGEWEVRLLDLVEVRKTVFSAFSASLHVTSLLGS